MAARRCVNCGEIVDSSWKFCPGCGEELYTDFFSEFISEFNERIRRMARAPMQNHNFEAFDATPMFSHNAGGFSVKITRKSGGEKPAVEIKTFGNVRPEDVERSLQAQGLEVGGSPGTRALNPGRGGAPKGVQKAAPKSFSEPQTKVTSEGARVVVEMNLPKISSIRDVEIAKMESSIEVRAYGKEQGYFKIIAIPSEAHIVGKSFSGGVLRLELEK
ncbi:MAG: zinc ribbon domain-containing protein [archaeon]